MKPRRSLSRDRQRFVLVEPVADEEDKLPAIHVVENWLEEFRELGAQK